MVCTGTRTRHMILKAQRGMLHSRSVLLTKYGLSHCPWVINVSPGQTISLELSDWNHGLKSVGGEAEDVAIGGTMIDMDEWASQEPMERLPGTDLFFKSFSHRVRLTDMFRHGNFANRN